MSSQIRQNYHEDCEALINKQINMELYLSYVYLSIGYYFDQDEVALPGIKELLNQFSNKKREHAKILMKFQNERSGKIVYQAIEAPPMQEWGNGLNSLEYILSLEKQLNESLLDLHTKVSEKNDPHLSNFIEHEFLDEQVEFIKMLGDMISRLKRAGPTNLGEYIFDKDIPLS